MVIIFLSEPKIGANETICTASNGRVYVYNGDLHIEYDVRHLVYKNGLKGKGWYRVTTEKDYYLGANCAPTAKLENNHIEDESAWEKVIRISKERSPAEKIQQTDENK